MIELNGKLFRDIYRQYKNIVDLTLSGIYRDSRLFRSFLVACTIYRFGHKRSFLNRILVSNSYPGRSRRVVFMRPLMWQLPQSG